MRSRIGTPTYGSVRGRPPRGGLLLDRGKDSVVREPLQLEPPVWMRGEGDDSAGNAKGADSQTLAGANCPQERLGIVFDQRLAML